MNEAFGQTAGQFDQPGGYGDAIFLACICQFISFLVHLACLPTALDWADGKGSADMIKCAIPERLRNGRYLDIIDANGVIYVSYNKGIDNYFGLQIREKEVRWVVCSRMKRLGKVGVAEASMTFRVVYANQSHQYIEDIISEMERMIEVIARRPISLRTVEEILGISNRERLRWTKDGRLPVSGHSTARKGQLIRLNTYSVDGVAALKANPQIIADWRAADGRGAGVLSTDIDHK